MRLFGWVVFDDAGERYRFTSNPGSRIELWTGGVDLITPRGVDALPWEAIRSLSGWAPVPRGGRAFERHLVQTTSSANKLCDSANVAGSAGSKRHDAYGHRSQVGDCWSSSESHADDHEEDET